MIVIRIWLICSVGMYLLALCLTISNTLNRLFSVECGFESLGATRVIFSLNFYVILLVFLVFDLEIVFLFGFLFGGSYILFLTILFFIFIRFYLERSLGSFL